MAEQEKQQSMIYIIEVKPGAADQALRYRLDPEKNKELLEGTVEDVITYGLGINVPRGKQRLQEAIRMEMEKRYGITANGEAVKGSDSIRKYLTEREMEGQKYLGVDLIVASEQTGGLERSL